MSNINLSQVIFVTGMRAAIDQENKIFLAAILSESPFVDDEQTSSAVVNPISFAFTRQQATFLRDRLDEFLREEI